MFILPDLPYARDALAPVISAQTTDIHHGRHHRACVDKASALAAEAGLAGRTLEEVVAEARRRGDRKLFNNAAQAWNHAFFWVSMAPAPSKPSGALAAAIDGTFGDLSGLRDASVAEGVNHFGSGWVWLTAGPDGLQTHATHDAEPALPGDGLAPLLVCDVWEHAYYLDHRNDRKGFLEAWFDQRADWAFAARQFAAARGEGAGFRHPPPQA